MFKVHGPKNPHDQFEEEWSYSDIKEKTKQLSFYKKELLQVIQKYLKKTDKIIEAGCGLGQFVLHYKNKGYDIVGVDFVKKAIDKLKEYDSTLKLCHGDCTKLIFDDNSFDVYLSFGVIEHLESGPEPFLYEAYRILKPNGIGVITVPNEECKAFSKIYSPQEQAKFSSFFEYGFTKSDLEQYLNKTGFEILEYRYHDYYVPLGLKKIFKYGVKEPYKLNWLGKIAEFYYRFKNDSKNAWMIGVVVRKK